MRKLHKKLRKGSLYDILYLNRSLNLTIETKINFVREILLGINYIHQSPVKIIGNLTSRNCMIDSRFHIRIGDFDLATCDRWIRRQGLCAENCHYHDLEEEKLLWIAPEVLIRNDFSFWNYRQGLSNLPRSKYPEEDMYSFGIILQELIFAQGPAFTAEIITIEEKVAKMLTNELVLVKQNFSGVQLTRFQRDRYFSDIINCNSK